MRIAARFVTAAMACSSVLLPFGVPAAAAAESMTLPAGQGAWFWDKQVSGEIVPGSGAPYPFGLPPSQAGQIDPDRLGVSYQGGSETSSPEGTKTAQDGERIAKPEKETYLAWELFDLVPGTVIDRFTFVLPLDPAGRENSLTNGPPALIACLATRGFASGQGDPFVSKPTDDCTEPALGHFDAEKQWYEFDVTEYAQIWVDTDNYGLGVRPALDTTVPFQLQFLNFDKAVAQVSYTLADDDFTDGGGGFEPPATFDPGFPGEAVDPGTGFEGDVLAPQPEAQPPAAPPAPVTPRPDVAFRPASGIPFSQDSSLPFGFWVAVVAGLVVLAVISLILGDDEVPTESAQRERTLGRLLRQRSSSGARHTSGGGVRFRPA